ncbi:MAG: ribose-phosphate pyrophosphokinase [Candidatus Sumerlaeota bacterium]|nr:ribose-phosphate pyrophosphokinase [Candidatus Sumerlaeota bacterium]
MTVPMIFSGSAHRSLTEAICQQLEIQPGKIESRAFKDGERFVKILENVRGRGVFVVQPSSNPANEHIMELLLIMDALKRASARSITAVIPYFGYSRQDRKEQGRVPISSKLVANLLTVAGATRVITVDLHVGQIQGFFDIPVDHLLALKPLSAHAKTMNIENAIVLSPDIGSVARARTYAEQLNLPMAIVDKRRPCPGEAEVMNLIGEIKGRNILIFDDMIDTAGTLCSSVNAIIEQGARDIYAFATHGIFSADALEKLNASPIKKVIVTNTIPQDANKAILPKLEVVSVAPLLAETINRVHSNQSVSELFDPRPSKPAL